MPRHVMRIAKTATATTLLSIFVKKSLNIHLLLEQSANENLNVPQVNNEAKEKPQERNGMSEEKRRSRITDEIPMTFGYFQF